MKTEIIISESRLKRYKSLSFVLSFFFTGLGQVYNGDLSRAVVFITLRFLSLLIIPLFAITQGSNFSVLLLIIPVLLNFIIWLISPIEATHSASGKAAFNLKKYNSILFYFFYIIITSALIISSALFVLSFFSIAKIISDDMNPGLLKDEYILINKYIKNVSTGDVILFCTKNTCMAARVIAREGNSIINKNKIYFINDTSLTYSIIHKSDLEKMKIVNSEDLFYEVNSEIKYPVRLEQKKDKASSNDPVFVKHGNYFTAFDNRNANNSYYLIESKDIAGRVEGIIFSRQIKRILNKMHLKAD